MSITLRTKEQKEPLIQLIGKDLPAFFHMDRSLNLGRPLILSDDKDCLMTQDSPTEPMWIWTSQTISDESLEEMIFSLSALRTEENLRAIVSKKQIAKLISLAFENEIERKQRILVYELKTLQPAKAEGKCIPGAEVEPDIAGDLIALMMKENGEELSAVRRNSLGTAFSQSPDSFAWRTETGEIASIARIARLGNRYAEVHTVITEPKLRNHGYAQALLTEISLLILSEGLTPMLYADRDYLPSNAVYRKIGFSVKDQLTAVRFRK